MSALRLLQRRLWHLSRVLEEDSVGFPRDRQTNRVPNRENWSPSWGIGLCRSGSATL
jgi:hypothetical protein